MTNYLIVEEVLKKADRPLSGDQIHKRAKEQNENIRRTTISTILNKMLGKEKISYNRRQVEDIRIKFWEWK